MSEVGNSDECKMRTIDHFNQEEKIKIWGYLNCANLQYFFE